MATIPLKGQPLTPNAAADKEPQIQFFIDGERYETHAHDLTPRQLLAEFAGLDPETYYLIEIHGRDQVSYETTPDALIHMRQALKFITAKSGPTPVS